MPTRIRHRPRLLRGRVATRALPVLLALSAGVLTAGIVSRAEARADAYGSRRSVTVAAHDLEVGATIGPDDLEVRDLPDALVPGRTIADPETRVVEAPILAGEPIAATRVAPDGRHGVAALVPSGRRAMAIPLDGAPPPLLVGDRIDLIGGRDASVVADGALVVDVGERAVTVALRDADVSLAARAILDGSVLVVLSG